jgi:endonuclease YncB( thermonuclease family)
MRRRRRGWPLLLAVVACLAAGAAMVRGIPLNLHGGPPGRAALTGHAVVTDGDTISLNGQRIRLEGVDAPEAAQRCEREGVPWPCGADATFALQLFLQGRVLRCTDNGRDRYQRILARCWVGEQDLGAWLVREGWAVAYTEYSWRYLPEELAARWDGRGLWAGRFERPADWRRRNAR